MTKTAALSDVEIPPHVDPRLVVDFDFFADPRYEAAERPHDALIRLGEEYGRGIFWTPRNGGHWFITDHEMLFEAARSPELFSNVNASFPPVPVEEEAYFPPLSLDPPEHIKYRLPLMRAFAPAKVQKMEEEIRSLVVALVDAVSSTGSCEFVDAIAEPLPITIFMQMIGFDLSRYKEFREWVSWFTQADTDLRTQAFRNTIEMARPLIEERRVNPRDDLLTQLVQYEMEGRRLTQGEVEGICILLLAAGLDTVVNMLSFGMEHLARNPELQDQLRASPELIPEAVEELLRRYSVVFPTRRVARDNVFHGAELKEGDRVSLYLAMGNLDPAIFPEPDRFELHRENKTHISFVIGPHRCVGSHLARLELVIFLEEWMKRMPNVRIDPQRPVGYRTNTVYAVTSLPLVYNAL